MKHLLKLLDLSKEEITELLDLADRLKAETKAGVEHHILKGKTLGMIFEKSSTRTRVACCSTGRNARAASPPNFGPTAANASTNPNSSG